MILSGRSRLRSPLFTLTFCGPPPQWDPEAKLGLPEFDTLSGNLRIGVDKYFEHCTGNWKWFFKEWVLPEIQHQQSQIKALSSAAQDTSAAIGSSTTSSTAIGSASCSSVSFASDTTEGAGVRNDDCAQVIQVETTIAGDYDTTIEGDDDDDSKVIEVETTIARDDDDNDDSEVIEVVATIARQPVQTGFYCTLQQFASLTCKYAHRS